MAWFIVASIAVTVICTALILHSVTVQIEHVWQESREAGRAYRELCERLEKRLRALEGREYP